RSRAREAARVRGTGALPHAPRRRRAGFPELAAGAAGCLPPPRARHLRARGDGPRVGDPRAGAAPAASGPWGNRAAPARGRRTRLALRLAGAFALGSPLALLASRGRRSRA